jgi:hypothetical protein
VKEYGSGKYDLAYKSFDYYRTVLPEDTNAIYYTGLLLQIRKKLSCCNFKLQQTGNNKVFKKCRRLP